MEASLDSFAHLGLLLRLIHPYAIQCLAILSSIKWGQTNFKLLEKKRKRQSRIKKSHSSSLRNSCLTRKPRPLFFWSAPRTRTLATSKAGSPQITDFRLVYARSEIWNNSNCQRLKNGPLPRLRISWKWPESISWCWPREKRTPGTWLLKFKFSRVFYCYFQSLYSWLYFAQKNS